jgi:hypothetical protein
MSTSKLIQEEIYFNGGLDSDSDDKFVSQGDYVDALNMVKVEDGENGIMVNVKGNKAVYNKGGAELAAFLVGWAFYDKNESVILFIYYGKATPPNYGNKIVEFNPETGAETSIINNILLAFEDPTANDYFVKADILGDWLAWTDNTNPPRMINLEDISGVSDLTTYIDLHKEPPTASSTSKHVPPLVSMGIDSSKAYNNITTGYQFKYRYVYKDFRTSTYSRASDLAISTILTRSLDGVTTTSAENYINVQFDSGNDNVRYIDIAVREGNPGSWFRIIKIDKESPENIYSTGGVLQSSALSDNTDYVYRFYNNEGRVAISDTEANKAYDTIPDTSESLSFIGENRLVLGGNVEGKDLIDIDVTLVAEYNNPGLTDEWSAAYSRGSTFIIQFDWDDLFSGARPNVYVGDSITWSFSGVESHDSGSDLTYALTQVVVFNKSYTSVSDILDYLVANSNLPSESGYTAGTWTVSKGAPNTMSFINTPASGSFDGTISSVNATTASNTTYDYYTPYGYVNDLAFKRSHIHKLALIYEDKYGNKYPALTSKDTNIEMEAISGTEGSGSLSGTFETGFAHIKYTISNSAPADAIGYRWAYAYKPKIFLQTFITDESYFEDPDGDLNTKQIALDISANNQFIPDHYTLEVGDIIRIIKEGGSYTTTGDFITDAPEFIIRDLRTSINDGSNDLTGTWLILNAANVPGYSYDDINDPSKFMNALVEIYKETSEPTDYIYYEIGSGGYCEGGTVNHDDWYTGNATGYLNQGDVWVRPVTRYIRAGAGRTAIALITEYLEDPYPYVDAPRADVGIADVNIEVPESRSKYDNTLRWSNKFFQDTQVNGLSTFDFDNKKDVADNHGRIKGLEELGNSLVIICEEKVLSSYVGATEYTDVKGNINVVQSTIALGYIRPHEAKYGTLLKESIVNTGKYIYFFDLFNGAVIRKSANGLFPISGKAFSPQGSYDYKMRTFFRELSENLITSLYVNSPVQYYDVKCFMGFDPYYENIYLTFVDRETSANNVSIIFNENSNRWISKYTGYLPSSSPVGEVIATMYPFTKHNIFHYADNDEGNLYELNRDDVNRCKLYGADQDSYIQFITHASPNIVKAFNSIAVHADSEYVVDPIETDANDSYSNGMYTKILSTEFVKEEGVYRAFIPKNMKTRTSVATNYDRINGEDIRAYVMKIKMTNSATDKVELFKVDIASELSR